MKTTKRIALCLFLLLACLASAHAKQPQGALWAASDGQGRISLFWIPKDLVWPAGGWRLESVIEGKGRVLAEKIIPGGDAAAMALLSETEAAAIGSVGMDLTSGALTEEERKQTITVMGLSAAINPAFGLAIGLRYEDTDPQGGMRTYRLTSLNSKGKPLSVLTSAAVDPAAATVLPEAPPSFSATPNGTGVALTWLNPQPNRLVPVLAFVLEREDATGGDVLLTEQPLLITRSDVKDQSGRYVDPAPPKESETTYRIFSIDMFGRRSLPRTVTQFIPDLSALNPPALFARRGGREPGGAFLGGQSQSFHQRIRCRTIAAAQGPLPAADPRRSRRRSNPMGGQTIAGWHELFLPSSFDGSPRQPGSADTGPDGHTEKTVRRRQNLRT